MDEDTMIAALVGELDLVGQYDDDVGYWDDDVGASEPDEIRNLLALVSGSDLIGVEELIGASPARANPKLIAAAAVANERKRVAAMIKRAQSQRGVSPSTGRTIAATPQHPSKGRVLMFGGAATQGATAGLLTISATAQEMCRVDRIFISAVDSLGAAIPLTLLTVADIRVGTRSQLAAIGALPGVMFSADATAQGQGLSLDTVQPGTSFSVQITSAPALSTVTWGSYATALR
jgi:hypothetical protein